MGVLFLTFFDLLGTLPVGESRLGGVFLAQSGDSLGFMLFGSANCQQAVLWRADLRNDSPRW